LWVEKVCRLCIMEEAGFLHYKFLCQNHFSLTDFMTPEGIHLNRLSVPCDLDLASHFIPQSSLPLLCTLSNPQPLEISPQNNNLPILPPLPLPSELTPEENNLQVLPPLRTYSKVPLFSTRIETPIPNHTDGPSTSSQISVPKPTPASANMFFCGIHHLFPQLRCFWWGIQVLQWPKFFLKAWARHSLLKEFNLALSD
jgi:hypothetical protein